MDIKQMLPLLLKGRLGEKEQALLKATQTSDPAALTALISQLYEQRAPRTDTAAIFKRLVPAKTLGDIIKYFQNKRSGGR